MDKFNFKKHSDKVFRESAQKSIKKIEEIDKRARKTVKVEWTPSHQSYHSAGDEAEPYCGKCEYTLEDNFKYCPICGNELDWGNSN